MHLFNDENDKEFAVFFILISSIVIVYPIYLLEYLLSGTRILPYVSPFIEEIVKSVVLFYFIRKTLPDMKYSLIYGLAMGGGYGFVENLLYSVELIPSPYFFSIMALRFIYPILIHMNSSIVFSGMAQKKFALTGLMMAILIHLIYNIIVLL
ncbi:MAG: PrsW family intramembrane metalloprotease [Candidatus Aenigmarchaeota archaeon]|nr:PrsW family intramembrane metalloprotease [Candidatus Aenigmarchaeota archaeon]